MIYVVVQGFLGWATPSCDPLSLTAPFLGNTTLAATLFGGRRTGVVGLTSALMAVTDRLAVAYYSKAKVRVATWPLQVNVSLGGWQRSPTLYLHEYFFLLTPRKVLSTFQTFCPVGVQVPMPLSSC